MEGYLIFGQTDRKNCFCMVLLNLRKIFFFFFTYIFSYYHRNVKLHFTFKKPTHARAPRLSSPARCWTCPPSWPAKGRPSARRGRRGRSGPPRSSLRPRCQGRQPGGRSSWGCRARSVIWRKTVEFECLKNTVPIEDKEGIKLQTSCLFCQVPLAKGWKV